MVLYVLDALRALTVERVWSSSPWSTEIVKTIQTEPQQLAIEFVEQFEPRGTGEATAVALTGFPALPPIWTRAT